MEIVLGFILQKQNEHQAGEFVEYCRRIGADRYEIIGTCLKTVDQGKDFLPANPDYRIYDEDEYHQGRLVTTTRPDNYCGWIHSAMNIHVNGDVVPCCRDPKGEHVLGNIFEESWQTIWNNEKYQKLRQVVATNSNRNPLCALCPGEGLAPPGRN